MRASSGGDVWLPDFVAGALRVERHLVVGRDGAALGAAVFPRPFQVLDANDRFVLGVHADELEVLSVAVNTYRLGP